MEFLQEHTVLCEPMLNYFIIWIYFKITSRLQSKLISLLFFFLKNFIKTFQDLGAKNLEPVEVNILLKHPYIQDLIANYLDYKIPVSMSQNCPNLGGPS